MLYRSDVITSVETLARLVGIPTISKTPNDAMTAYIAGRMREAGGRVRVLPGVNPGTSNLLASFGPENEGGIVLSGHGDVVPVAGQDWSTDPFTLTERNAQLYARGASDMKGFIACMVTAAERTAGTLLARPLHLAISCDEEIGCVGVRPMLERLAAESFRAFGCIIGEPTGLAVATGHKGKVAGCICCRGEAAHSANPALGSNAINLAAGMIRETEALQTWLRDHGARDAAYALPHSTVHIGTIKGGTALNIVPEACDMEFEIRYLHGDSPDDLLARLTQAGTALARSEVARGRHANVEVIVRNLYPGLQTPRDAPITALVCRAAGTARGDKLSFGSEAGLFSDMLGLPAVICGPGSMDRAHKPDEYITADELAGCDLFLDRVIMALQ